MQVIRRRNVPRKNLDNAPTEDRARDPLKSYFSTEVRQGQIINIPGPCEIIIKGFRDNVVSLAFKIDRGLIIKKSNAQRQSSED